MLPLVIAATANWRKIAIALIDQQSKRVNAWLHKPRCGWDH